jgi:hypothetical protein
MYFCILTARVGSGAAVSLALIAASREGFGSAWDDSERSAVVICGSGAVMRLLGGAAHVEGAP